MRIFILLAGIVLVLATSSLAQSPTPTVVPTPAQPLIKVESLTVSPSNPSMPSGHTVQLIVTGTMTNGSTMPNVPVLWHADNPFVAAIAPNGIVTAGNAGSAQITATFAGVTATTTVMVSATPTAIPTPLQRR